MVLFLHLAFVDPRAHFHDLKTQLHTRIRLVSRPPFHGVLFPLTYSNATSDQRRACLTRLCYAFRFFQPLDVLFRLRPFSLVSCRFRLWDFRFQRFPPSRSRCSLHRSLPFCLGLLPPPHRLYLVPRNETPPPLWKSSQHNRSEKRLRHKDR